MPNNNFVPGQEVVIFVEGHHTFKVGQTGVVHPDHSPDDDFVKVRDPDTPSEYWVFELHEMKPPSPEELQRIKDENFYQVVLKVGKKRVVVNRENYQQVSSELMQQVINAQAALKMLTKLF